MHIPSSPAFVETLSFDDPTLANALFGPQNAHVAALADKTGADISTRGATLSVAAEDPALRERILNLFTQFYGLVRTGHTVQASDLEQGLQLLESGLQGGSAPLLPRRSRSFSAQKDRYRPQYGPARLP